MISSWLLIGISLGYWLILFAIAWWAERLKKRSKPLSKSPYIYALSLAVYCTAWTFFGSIGKVKEGGIDFLAVYIGPTLMSIPAWFILKKIIRICKAQQISTIADFISSRYGKNLSLAALVTVFLFFGIIPYISLQLKAISESFNLLTRYEFANGMPKGLSIFGNTALIMAIGMAMFSVLFGTRRIESNEKHEGMIAAIAFESIIKLIAFVSAGIFVCFGVFNGFGDIFSKAYHVPSLQKLFVIPDNGGFGNWFWISALSGMAVLFLPRQFQVAVVENTDEKHLNKSIWLFPLYLLIINIFVLPIAFGGQLLFSEGGIDSDYYILDIPLMFGQKGLALLVFIGGYAAATGMIIVETIALSTMFSNHLVIPMLLAMDPSNVKLHDNLSKIIIQSRRLGIIFILTAAYLYYKVISGHYSLVSIGLISFVSVAQLMPSILGGIFWKRGNKIGALVGLILGFITWFYTLVLPSLVGTAFISESFVSNGPFGIWWLKPYAILGLQGFSPIVHSLFWSMLLNIGAYIGFSVFSVQTVTEQNQAEIFVEVNRYAPLLESTTSWKGTAYLPDITSLLSNFLGSVRTNQALNSFAQRNQINLNENKADPKLVAYAERVLSGIIGSASARIMVSATVKEEEIKIDELLNILKESQQLMRLNKELTRKTDELEKARQDLELVNIRLKEQDELKDDFLTTVTHELRTPITSIRAFSEIIYDNDDLETEERQHYLGIIIKETERISRLISQVLDLEKYDSGKQKLNMQYAKVQALVEDSAIAVDQLLREKGLVLIKDFEPNKNDMLFDADKIQQVIVNLLSNAIKFTHDEIRLKLRYTQTHWQFYIEDNGPGLDPTLKELIFEKFYQAKNQTIRKPKGSGLGLAISKRIIDLHQGTLTLLDAPQMGAVFLLEVPINPLNLPNK